MIILVKTLQVILALSVLIIIHEFGHFMWARIFGIRVEKFYLFFDFGGVRLAHWKWGETEFGIGWFPLGGYCKIAGMVDESMDLDQLKKEPQPWEFRSHKAWHRLLVLAGGVLNNFIFAIICFMAIMGIWGQSYISNQGTKILASELAQEMGFRTGDEILSFDDYVPDNFGMLQADLARRNVQVATVLRGADTVRIYIDHSLIGEVLNTPYMFDLALPFVIDSVANSASPLLRGDHVVAFDGKPVEYVHEAREVLAGLAGREIEATVLRGADTLDVPLQVDSAGMIGVVLKMPDIKKLNYSFLQAIPAGWKYTWETVGGYLRDLRLLAQPSSGAYKSVGSFIAIGSVFPATWDWYQFLSILALLSIMLAVMNLIPIPGLDGGHIMFVLYEMISGRKPSEKFLTIMQMIGLVLIAALMVLAFGNDIGRIIH